MKIGIIGGGISGCFAALRIKELHPNYEVTIFEHNENLLKKIYATGNGKCNFANSGSLTDKYSNENIVLPIIEQFGYQKISSYFNKLGIPNVLEGDLAYPMSKSAQTVGMMFIKRIEELGIKVLTSCEVKNYKIVGNCRVIETNLEDFSFDKIVVSTGGKSSPQLGSDGSIFDILNKHNYQINELKPSLCPILVKENTKLVDGVRSEAKVTLFENGKEFHSEIGEVLFKDKGLSGIVIFNACHYINLKKRNNVQIRINLVPRENHDVIKEDYIKYVNPKLAKYLLNNNLDIKNLIFTFKGFYDYSTSQVTSGGLSFSYLNEKLESVSEPGVYFIGEVLDVDAICGGYNMMWCFASADHISRGL